MAYEYHELSMDSMITQMDEFRDYDVSCNQPSHLEKFYEDYFAYNDKNGWITIPDYYNNVYVKELA